MLYWYILVSHFKINLSFAQIHFDGAYKAFQYRVQ